MSLCITFGSMICSSGSLVPLKGKVCVFAWSDFHLEVGKRICFAELSFGRDVLSLGIFFGMLRIFENFNCFPT